MGEQLNLIGCGQCSYTYLIIPKLLTMGVHTEKLLRQFVMNGGKVLLWDGRPEFLEGEPFNYDYLISNCTLEDILQAQPFAVENTDNELYYTYRLMDGKAALFVQNASDRKGYTQTFSFKDGTNSFLELDPISGDTRACPLTIRLEKNESMLLFLSYEPVLVEDNPKTLILSRKCSTVEFDTNYLTLDAVQYSKDGIHFSDVILCSDLCQQLLQERYEGKIWIRYAFEIKELPESLHLLSEKSDSKEFALNGKPVVFCHTLQEEPCVAVADITSLVRLGTNHYDTALNWHQSEETYYIFVAS